MSARTAAVALAVVTALGLTGCGAADRPAGTALDATEGTAFPRTVEHAMGATELPERPERVVVLDTGELDAVLSLGVTPVGAVTTDAATGFLSYLAEGAEGVEQVGTIGEPNLEAIAALEPDLILSNAVRHEELYDQLSAIAPTVLAEEIGAAWQDNLRLAAEALGLEAEAEDALAGYERQAAELGGSLGDRQVSAIRFVEGAIRVYSADSFIGTVLADIGLDQLELPTGEVSTFAELSPEEVPRVDADVVLYSSYGAADDSGEATVVAGPLWPRLDAVREGRAHAVEDDVFYSGIGLRAATLVVADLRERLAG